MSQAELLLHQYQVSPYAAKVRRALHYKGIPFSVRDYAVVDAGKIRKTISPSGKTPVLEHEGRLIVDSTTILRYLDQKFPSPSVLPADPALRAQAHIIEDWADESLFFYDLTMRGWPNNIEWLKRDVLSHDRGFMRWLMERLIPGFVKKTGETQGVGRKDRATVCAEVEAHFDAIVDLLGDGDYLVGDQLSVADIAVASMCTVIERAEEAAAMMAERPTLQAWRERVDQATFPAGTAAADRAIS
ncbi:MAG: glutathione S-transferase family protein [Halieaceae bacterium]